jgi:hypothetical protein
LILFKRIKQQNTSDSTLFVPTIQGSHLSQVWAQTLQHIFNVKNVFCYEVEQSYSIIPNGCKTLEQAGSGKKPF